MALRDVAWRRIFDESENTLRHQFALDYPELRVADFGSPLRIWEDEWTHQHKRRPTPEERLAIPRAHGIEPWHDRPNHFILWAWEQHRVVEHEDLLPYELDQAHWQLLTGESDQTCDKMSLSEES